MPKIRNKSKISNKSRTTLLVIAGIFAFLSCILINIVGLRQTVDNKSTSMVGFYVPSNDNNKENLEEKKTDLIDEEKIVTNSIVLVKLEGNNWDRMKANFINFTTDENNNAIYDDYILYCNNGTYVNYVVFNENYEKEIIGNVKVSDSLEKIQEKLGTPTFKVENGIGYKTETNYTFFYENEAVSYANRAFSNQKLEELITNYYNKTYSGYRTNFVLDIKNSFSDFSAEMDGEDVVLTSIARQIVIRLLEDGDIEVNMYNGYQISSDFMEEFIDKKIFTKNTEDLVEITEIERSK